MNQLFRFVTLALATIFISCSEGADMAKKPDVGFELEQLSDGPFTIDIRNMHSSYCSVEVTPDSDAEYIWYSAVTEYYLSQFGSLSNLDATIENFISETIAENEGYRDLVSLIHIGKINKTVEGLAPNTRFIVFACHISESGEIISDIEAVAAVTPPLTPSDNKFTVEVVDITAVSAYVTIDVTNDDRYVWMELPEDIYEGMSKEELKQFLLKHYTPFFASKSRSGDQTYLFPDTLDPDTNYMIIVFGYDGGMTTPLTTKVFRTLPEGDPENVTFGFEYGDMTSRSLKLTITPSDLSVSYLSIVAPEELILEYGTTVNAESVRRLLEDEIAFAIESGDVDDRDDFIKTYSSRGVKESEYSLTPATKHYACAVCVDKEGHLASNLFVDEGFVSPQTEQTTASVSVAFERYYDGDLLYGLGDAIFEGYQGCVVLPVWFTLDGGADAAIFSCFTSSSTADVTDDEIVAMMTSERNLDVYTYFTEPRLDLLLDWGVEYELFMLAIDPRDNISDLQRVIIPAASREGASSVADYPRIEDEQMGTASISAKIGFRPLSAMLK